MFSKFWKIPEITCAVEFHFIETDGYRPLQNSYSEQLPSAHKKDCNMDVLLESFQIFLVAIFSQTLMEGWFQQFKQPFV